MGGAENRGKKTKTKGLCRRSRHVASDAITAADPARTSVPWWGSDKLKMRGNQRQERSQRSALHALETRPSRLTSKVLLVPRNGPRDSLEVAARLPPLARRVHGRLAHFIFLPCSDPEETDDLASRILLLLPVGPTAQRPIRVLPPPLEPLGDHVAVAGLLAVRGRSGWRSALEVRVRTGGGLRLIRGV